MSRQLCLDQDPQGEQNTSSIKIKVAITAQQTKAMAIPQKVMMIAIRITWNHIIQAKTKRAKEKTFTAQTTETDIQGEPDTGSDINILEELCVTALRYRNPVPMEDDSTPIARRPRRVPYFLN